MSVSNHEECPELGRGDGGDGELGGSIAGVAEYWGTMSACKEDIQRPLLTHDDVVAHSSRVAGNHKFNETCVEGELGSKWVVSRKISTDRWYRCLPHLQISKFSESAVW